MAGWRVGTAVGHREFIESLYKMKTHADSGHFLPVMEAAVSAMIGDQTWLVKRNLTYQERRDVLVDSLNTMGFSVSKPLASIYIWCPIPDKWESEIFVLEALKNIHVSFAPGTVFGSGWHKYIRISLTQPFDRIEEAMERLKSWL
jgi:LL-diaminopimelate aminotransferase